MRPVARRVVRYLLFKHLGNLDIAGQGVGWRAMRMRRLGGFEPEFRRPRRSAMLMARPQLGSAFGRPGFGMLVAPHVLSSAGCRRRGLV